MDQNLNIRVSETLAELDDLAVRLTKINRVRDAFKIRCAASLIRELQQQDTVLEEEIKEIAPVNVTRRGRVRKRLKVACLHELGFEEPTKWDRLKCQLTGHIGDYCEEHGLWFCKRCGLRDQRR